MESIEAKGIDVHTAWLFTEKGCTFEGLVQIHGTDPADMIPAYVFSIQ